MKEVFADTFYFLALLNPTDDAYEEAVAITSGEPSTLVTTVWVLAELANSLSKRQTRAGFVDAIDALRANPTAVIVGLDQDLFNRGIGLYAARRDKDWSLTDCISFIVMQERGITDALTGDHHFEQAGFKPLLR